MDVVVVARARAVSASYQEMDRAFVRCAEKTGLIPKTNKPQNSGS